MIPTMTDYVSDVTALSHLQIDRLALFGISGGKKIAETACQGDKGWREQQPVRSAGFFASSD